MTCASGTPLTPGVGDSSFQYSADETNLVLSINPGLHCGEITNVSGDSVLNQVDSNGVQYKDYNTIQFGSGIHADF